MLDDVTIPMARYYWQTPICLFIVDQHSLEKVEFIKGPVVFCVAALFGKVRLIDNMEINL
ncbi:pantoate-beta-alanine ligase [Trifolium medium]|uniref:Pantoate-beta-alanine ligase n=1 Tax=Trifolium medium TaxID=97028 RepID=A0A392NUC4_9FABA|nr:pantoate-beta-alanine ligase [Trifolium medium]